MDAVTLVAAAVAIAIDDSRQAALNDLLLDREHAAMRAADAESQLAERVRCARCGDTSNLEVMPRSGPWVDAPVPARTYCRQCLYGS